MTPLIARSTYVESQSGVKATASLCSNKLPYSKIPVQIYYDFLCIEWCPVYLLSPWCFQYFSVACSIIEEYVKEKSPDFGYISYSIFHVLFS